MAQKGQMAAFDYCLNGSPSYQFTEHNMLPKCRSHRHFDSETILSIVPKLDVGLPILIAFCLPRSVVLALVPPEKANQEPHAFYVLVAHAHCSGRRGRRFGSSHPDQHSSIKTADDRPAVLLWTADQDSLEGSWPCARNCASCSADKGRLNK